MLRITAATNAQAHVSCRPFLATCANPARPGPSETFSYRLKLGACNLGDGRDGVDGLLEHVALLRRPDEVQQLREGCARRARVSAMRPTPTMVCLPPTCSRTMSE